MDPVTVYKKSHTGKVLVLCVWTEGEFLLVETGVHGGTMKTTEREFGPKNVGRANYCSAEEVAEQRAQTRLNKAKDKGYHPSFEEAVRMAGKEFRPMLARAYKPKNASWPMLIQAKLDGFRCLSYWENGEVILKSRQNKELDVPHIKEQLTRVLPEGYVFDGELYAHGESFSTIQSWIKRRQVDQQKLRYHIYDCIVAADFLEDRGYEDRFSAVEAVFEISDEPNLELVSALEVCNEQDVEEQHALLVEDGYEGAILRDPSAKYEQDKRSKGLLKYKKWLEDEFLVTHVRNGQGKMSDCAIFVCEVGLQSFECLVKCSMQERKKQFANRKKYIGEYLTVKFFEYTDSGIPRFPIGLRFRPDFDNPKKR